MCHQILLEFRDHHKIPQRYIFQSKQPLLFIVELIQIYKLELTSSSMVLKEILFSLKFLII